MRAVGLVLFAGCGFQHGLMPDDASIGGRDDAGGSAADARLDARSDAAPDHMPDSPTFSCSTTGLACAGTVAIHDCSGTCWVSCSQAVTQSIAAAVCAGWGGKLAPLRTQDDQDCLHDSIFPDAASWIGLVQAGGADAVDADWSWNDDGQPLTFTSWSPGQPNDANGQENGMEQCAYMSTSGGWQDSGCTATISGFACRD